MIGWRPGRVMTWPIFFFAMVYSPFVHISLARRWRKNQRDFEQPIHTHGPLMLGRLQRVFVSTYQSQTSH